MMIEDARNLIDELHTERLEYNEYLLLRNALDSLELDRDTWKARADKAEALAKRAVGIMNFHAGRCPLHPNSNFSGSEEHLAEYRQITQDGKYLFEPKFSQNL